jgi:hypothetical protein
VITSEAEHDREQEVVGEVVAILLFYNILPGEPIFFLKNCFFFVKKVDSSHPLSDDIVPII